MRPSTAQAQNTINIEDASFVTIRGLEIMSNGGDGIKLYGSGTNRDITLEDLVIHGVSVGINSQASVARLTVRRTEIYDTAMYGTTSAAIAGSSGGGMNLGCWDGSCSVSDSVIDNNWVHDTRTGNQGFGIEIRKNSFGNVVQNNVIYNTRFPCVLLNGSGGESRNVAEGNAMWNCEQGGIQVAADAVVRNNLVFDSGFGLISIIHNGVVPNNLEIIHNTIANAGTCLNIRDWNGNNGIVFANNAIYCSTDTLDIRGTVGVDMVGNVVFPGAAEFPSGSYIVGNGLSDFQGVGSGSLNAYPTIGSPLIDAGSSLYSTESDFDGRIRVAGSVDAGAYEWVLGGSPLWVVGGGFKASP